MTKSYMCKTEFVIRDHIGEDLGWFDDLDEAISSAHNLTNKTGYDHSIVRMEHYETVYTDLMSFSKSADGSVESKIDDDDDCD